MPQKRNDPLHGQQGFAMILVLCLGALFVALAAALVYAASLMLSNADRQLPEQDVYELAASFSDVLEQELLNYKAVKDDGTPNNDQSLGAFINYTYVSKGGLKGTKYGEDKDHTFTLQAPEGVDELTVTLHKTLCDTNTENDEESTNDSDSTTITTFEVESNTDMQTLYNNMRGWETSIASDGFADYDITVTVRAVKGNESYASTRKYRHVGMYEIYYTLSDEREQSHWTLDDWGKNDSGDSWLIFLNPPDRTKSVYNNQRLTISMQYLMGEGVAYECKFTRITSND